MAGRGGADELTTLELPASLETKLAQGHPWIYRDHVPPGFSAPMGTWVRVRAGRFSGYALWDAESPIALRVFSEIGVPDRAWIEERVRAAWQLREPLRSSKTSAYRWVFGEGDGLPGLVVDLYGRFAVMVSYTASLDMIVPDIVEALQKTAELHGILFRVRSAREDLELVWGGRPPREIIVEEHGIRLPVDLDAGQKTGLFLDQRENRRFIGGLARDQRVLNLFSYTGGFSIHAALGGAVHVTSVDVSEGALGSARRGFELNGIDPESHDFVAADVFEFLERAVSEKRVYDLVICDPPSFARNKAQLAAAEKAYTRLNVLGMRVTRAGGLFASASCTAQLSADAFREILAAAAGRARRRLQIVHDAGQPLDHPVMAGHREGRYLKFVAGRSLTVV